MDQPLISRILNIPKQKSFFLFGARGVGKSTWLTHVLNCDLSINLLENRTFLQFARDPGILDEKVGHLKAGSWVCIDEVQRVPELLTEVHKIMETRRLRFALTGSSARKLKHGGADMLAGRAITQFMEPFSATELKDEFNLDRMLKWGGLPLVYLDPENAVSTLDTYVNTYLREEIKEEGHVRKLEPFIRFLDVMGIMNGQIINGEAIAREARIPRSSVDNYFSILQDTLVGFMLPAYQPKAKVRESTHPKFYWFDTGVARASANLLTTEVDRNWLGFALETYIFHELRVYNHVFKKLRKLSYYRVQSGLEIDFVVELQAGSSMTKPKLVLIEVKSSKKWDRAWNKSMIDLKQSNRVIVAKMFGVYTGNEILSYGDVTVFPVQNFLARLYEGQIY